MPGVPSAPELRTDYLRFDPRDSRGSVEVPIKAAHDTHCFTQGDGRVQRIARHERAIIVEKSPCAIECLHRNRQDHEKDLARQVVNQIGRAHV